MIFSYWISTQTLTLTLQKPVQQSFKLPSRSLLISQCVLCNISLRIPENKFCKHSDQKQITLFGAILSVLRAFHCHVSLFSNHLREYGGVNMTVIRCTLLMSRLLFTMRSAFYLLSPPSRFSGLSLRLSVTSNTLDSFLERCTRLAIPGH